MHSECFRILVGKNRGRANTGFAPAGVARAPCSQPSLIVPVMLDAFPEFLAQIQEIVHPLFDLREDISSRSLHILISQFDEHLGDPRDGADGLDRVVFPK